MLIRRGLELNEAMNMLWEYGWTKLNSEWKDPDTGQCYSLQAAVKRCYQHQEETARILNGRFNQPSETLHEGEH